MSEPSAGIRAATIPIAPTNLIADSISDTQIVLKWTAPAYNGGNAISDYKLYYSVNDNTAYTLLSSTGSSSVLTLTLTASVVRGSTFYYKVTALNIIGESDYSTELEVLAATEPL